MTHDYVSKIKSVATGKNVLLFLIPACVIYLAMLLYTIPSIKQHAPGMDIFDMSPAGYSYEYAMQLLGELGAAGRDSYLYKQLPLDFIYPALFAVSSSLLIAWVFSKGKLPASRFYYLCLVPIVAGFLDYLENIQIILMIFSYPNVSENQVALASLTTIGKSGLTTIFFVILVVGLIRLALVRRTG